MSTRWICSRAYPVPKLSPPTLYFSGGVDFSLPQFLFPKPGYPFWQKAVILLIPRGVLFSRSWVVFLGIVNQSEDFFCSALPNSAAAASALASLGAVASAMASTAAAASVFTSSAAAAASALASSAAASSVFASFATAALALTSSEATASALACSAEELLPVALQRSLQQHTPILSTKIVCQSSRTAQNFLFFIQKTTQGLFKSLGGHITI